MRFIKTSDIAINSAMPFKSGALEQMQLSTKEITSAILAGIINDVVPLTNPTVLFGAVNTIVGATNTITAGAMVVNNEIYLTNSATVVLTGSQVVVGTITEQSVTGTQYNPFIFSDGTSVNVIQNRVIVWSAGASGSGTFNYNNVLFLQSPKKQTGTIATAQWENGSAGTTFNYYKIPFNKLVIDTNLEKIAAGSATIITLPVGYRPVVDRYFTTFGGTVNPDTYLTFKINSAGALTLHNSNGTLGLNTGDVYTIYAEIPLY
jgi:hypothetical protein